MSAKKAATAKKSGAAGKAAASKRPAVPARDASPPAWPAGRPVLQAAALALGLVALGLVVGSLGAFAHAQRAGSAPIGLPVTLAALIALTFAAGMAVRSRYAAGLPALGWLISVLVFAQPRGEGDLVVAGDGPGVAYLIAGLVTIGGTSLLPYHRVGDTPGV
ncbi:MAG: DUF6113 family protein [Sporichthyaceae bacterium]